MSGVPAATMFFEHLADADDAALKRLRTSPFRNVSLIVLAVAGDQFVMALILNGKGVND